MVQSPSFAQEGIAKQGRALGTMLPFPTPSVILIVPTRASLGHNSFPKGHQQEHPTSSIITSLPHLVPTGALPTRAHGDLQEKGVGLRTAPLPPQ